MTEPANLQPISYQAVDLVQAKDLSHLKTLAVFYYIFGALTILFSSIFIVHIVLGILMMTGNMPNTGGPPAPPVGILFFCIGLFAVLLGWSVGIATIYAGRCLAQQRHWVFTVVMASICCISFPLGTVLGVFSLIVLLRDSVKSRFEIVRAASQLQKTA